MHWEARFRDLARRQSGAIGIDQLSSIGCNGTHWARAKRNGRWHAVSRRVLLLDGTAPTADQRAHAAILDAGGGAVLHGPSTLAAFELPGYQMTSVDITRRRGTTSDRCDLARVHRLRQLRACDIVTVRGIPTVSPLRAIWSEASRYASPRLYEVGLRKIGRLLDNAHRRGLVSWEDLHRSIAQLGRRGRAGTRLMRELGRKRQPGSSPTDSRNEDRLEEIIAGTSLPMPLRQRVVGGDAPIGRSDHRDPDRPLVIEVNSLIFHSTPSDQAADEERYAAMADAGFTVAVVWEPDLWSNKGNVITTLRVARVRSRDGPPAVFHTESCPWPDDPSRLVIRSRRPPLRG